eukprot:59924-Prorocentrum_minimum.AAC.1
MGKAWVLSASPGLIGLSSYSSHSPSKKRPGAQSLKPDQTYVVRMVSGRQYVDFSIVQAFRRQ